MVQITVSVNVHTLIIITGKAPVLQSDSQFLKNTAIYDTVKSYQRIDTMTPYDTLIEYWYKLDVLNPATKSTT